MKITLTTDSLKGYGLNRIFEFAKELGFDGIDLVLDKNDLDTLDPEYIAKLSSTTEIPVLAVQALDNAKEKDLEEAVTMAKKVNAKVIVIQPPKILDRKYAAWLKKEVPNIRKKENISIALENAPNKMWLGFIPERAMNNLSELKRFKHACLDTARVAEKKEDLMYAYGSLQKFLVHVHISNFYRNKGYQVLTKGNLPLESFISKLASDGFKGALSIKIKPNYLKVRDRAEMFKLLKESKEFIEKFAKA
ncbi:MAG: sugar phosphate isomerase/epimerase [Patescibacteria group bacterium]|nr:sugar phosphate isomerase/epimerase [Patescibacteria group bacterium]